MSQAVKFRREFGKVEFDPSSMRLEEESDRNEGYYRFCSSIVQVDGFTVRVRTIDSLKEEPGYQGSDYIDGAKVNEIREGQVNEAEVSKSARDKNQIKSQIEKLKLETEWHALKDLDIKLLILYSVPSLVSREQIHRYVEDEFARIELGVQLALRDAPMFGLNAESSWQGIEFEVAQGLQDKIFDFQNHVLAQCKIHFIELRNAPRILRTLGFWRAPRTIIEHFLTRIEHKVKNLDLSNCLGTSDKIFGLYFNENRIEQIEEFGQLIVGLDSALSSLAGIDPRLGGTPTKYSRISGQRLEDAFVDYWAKADWQNQYFDRIFISSYLGIEAEAFLLHIKPNSALGALFMSNKKLKADLLRKLYELVDIVENRPCSIKYLRDKILEATASHCYVNPAVINLVDRLLGANVLFLE